MVDGLWIAERRATSWVPVCAGMTGRISEFCTSLFDNALTPRFSPLTPRKLQLCNFLPSEVLHTPYDRLRYPGDIGTTASAETTT